MRSGGESVICWLRLLYVDIYLGFFPVSTVFLKHCAVAEEEFVGDTILSFNES